VSTPGFALHVAVSGKHAYVANHSYGLQVIDITNPQNPEIVGSVDTPGLAQGVAVSGTHAYVTDWSSGLQVIDITNPQNPQIVGSVGTPSAARHVAVSGNHAYVADQTSGLQVINIKDPQSPQIVGSVDTPSASYHVAVSGAFVYVADGDALLVLPTQCKWTKTPMDDGGVLGPSQAALSAWPNPAVGSVALRFAVPSEQNPSLRIYDVSGRHIRTLATTSGSSEEQELLWDGNDDQGRSVASGTYFLRLQWAQGSATSRVMLLR
jgi:hypothetical protein